MSKHHIPAEWLCLHCGRVSYHPTDREEHYCGNCHHFCDDVDRVFGGVR